MIGLVPEKLPPLTGGSFFFAIPHRYSLYEGFRFNSRKTLQYDVDEGVITLAKRRDSVVLIVDDDPKVATIMARLLERVGYVVVTSGDGDEALAQAKDRDVGVIILDWRLPTGPMGSELIAALRGVCGERTPVLVVSGDWAAFPEADRALASDYLPKPFDPDDLVHLVDSYFAPPTAPLRQVS